jgi:hypothetical protein
MIKKIVLCFALIVSLSLLPQTELLNAAPLAMAPAPMQFACVPVDDGPWIDTSNPDYYTATSVRGSACIVGFLGECYALVEFDLAYHVDVVDSHTLELITTYDWYESTTGPLNVC